MLSGTGRVQGATGVGGIIVTMQAIYRAVRRQAAIAMLAAGALFGAAAAQAQTLPQYANDAHLGVGTCGGSTCHGAVQPWKNSVVLQNEYVTWSQKDSHSKAYQALVSERGKRIAANLGLPNAHEAKACLDCHSNNVPANLRSKTFNIADGVGCESCHGGAVRWLGQHVSGTAGHAENVALGMYPTENPIARAKLCLSCHVGNDQKFVTHRMMGAGHPRMSFELDTYTATMPAHFRIDDDYSKRKRIANGVQTWAIGQAMQVQAVMDGMLDPKRNRDGIFPELTFFDCHACHHPMSNVRWQARAGTGLGPGVPRLNDANLVMLRVVANHVNAELGARLRQETLALHAASLQGNDATQNAAKAVRTTAAALADAFAKHTFGRNDFAALLNGVLKEGIQVGEYVDYMSAEQATMALSAIVSAMQRGGMLNDAQHKSLTSALDKAYEAVAKDEAYVPKTFVAALQGIEAAIPKF
jgi:hypothetical protein